ncbi:MAG: hypothetical protein H8E32_08715 [Nitrospinae bacterium]|nr:hypothetical protein [Nitrospinota bacterium]
MNSMNRKQNTSSKGSKSIVSSGKNGTTKTKSMSAIAKLMATFYGIDPK